MKIQSEKLQLSDIEDLRKHDLKALDKVRRIVKTIIYSRMSSFRDLHVFIDDLVSNAFIVLFRSYTNYDPTKKTEFSTYAFNRIVSSSRKTYLALKYPYGGIKALSGKSKVLQEAFQSSALAYLLSEQDLHTKVSSNSIDDVASYIRTVLTSDEERRLLPKIMSMVNSSTTNPDVSRKDYREILDILRKRIGDQ